MIDIRQRIGISFRELELKVFKKLQEMFIVVMEEVLKDLDKVVSEICDKVRYTVALRKWFQEDYNQVRPHQRLGYMTPAEYLEKIKTEKCLA